MNAQAPAPAWGQPLMIEAVRWAYRLILGREAESEAVIGNWVGLGDPVAVLRNLAQSGEAALMRSGATAPRGDWLRQPLDEEAARAAFLLLRGQLPSAAAVGAILGACDTGAALRQAFLDSPEFAAAMVSAPGTEGAVPIPPAQPQPAEARVNLDGTPVRVRGEQGDAYWISLSHGGADTSATSLLRVVRAHLPDGGRGAVLLDVGAHIGLSSLAMALAAPDHALLLAVEPDPVNVGHLRHNLVTNGLERARVVEGALGALGGEGRLRVDAGNSATAHLVTAPSATEGAGRAVRAVPVERLDRLLMRHDCERLDVMKVDVEGSEEHVLAGAGDMLARYRTLVHIEFNLWTLMAVAGSNPRTVLENWAAAFPHIVAFGDDGSPWPLTTQEHLMWFLYVTVTSRNGLGDLILCQDLDWLSRWR
jgi:FkbM family methyltransferase